MFYNYFNKLISIISIKSVHMLRTSPSILKFLAAIVWFGGVPFLTLKSGNLLLTAYQNDIHHYWILVAVATGVLIGWLKAQLLFTRLCTKNLQRIDNLEDPKIWQFYRRRFFVFLFLMIFLGKYLAAIGKDNNIILILLASLEISIAIALLISGRCFLGDRINPKTYSIK